MMLRTPKPSQNFERWISLSLSAPQITAHKLFVEMPRRTPINSEQPPATNLRRSPRFLHKHVTDSDHPKTLQTKSSRARINYPKTPSFSSTQKVSAQDVRNSCPEKGSKRVNEANIGRKASGRPNIGSRRSARLNGRVEEFSYVELSPIGNVERRVTRSSVRGKTNSDLFKNDNGKLDKKATFIFCKTTNRYVMKTVEHDSTEVYDKDCSLDEHETSSFHEGNARKCTQKSGRGKRDGFDDCVSDEVLDRGVLLSAAVKERGDNVERGNNDEGQQLIGFKRKRNPIEKCHGIAHGWSKDQELALDRAYFATNPTPQFWKKVARLVPGKSAQECFNKIHSDHMTPPQAEPRSRAKRLSSPPNSLSASKLLKSSGPLIKKPTQCKKSRHIVQKTVRHLLQKQCQVDQNSEEDLFSVLEPRTSPSVPSIQQNLITTTTPDSKKERFGLHKRCRERSSSGKKKSLARFSNSKGTNLVSPPVLKQVKNKALHEKYVDLLHCREANRKAVSVKEAKMNQAKGVKEEGPRKDAIKAAKNALVFDASDAIKQFQDLQANALMSRFSDVDDDGVDYDEDDEGEDIDL